MRSCAFGLSLRFDGETPPGAWAPRAGRQREVVVRAASRNAIEAAWSGRESLGWEAQIDGLPFVVERGVRADYRFLHGAGVACHLDAEGTTLLHAAAGEDSVAGWRTVLDSVIFSVALLHGLEALHAGAVVSGEGAIAIAAASGGGKSTLLTSLLADGFELLADDVVALEADGELILGHPGPPLMTVPAAVPSPPGEELASIGAERWLATPVSAEPQPLTAVVLLNRRPGVLALRPLPKPLFPLLAMMLRFPRTPDRERSRFELAAAIAAGVPVWELRAEPTVPPAALAELFATPELQSGRAATNLRRA